MRAGLVASIVVGLAVLLLVPSGGLGAATHAATDPFSSLPSSPAFTPEPASSVEVAPAYAPSTGVTLLGGAGANTSLEVDVGLSSRNPAGLSAYLNATEVPGNSLYETFLPAGAADARFGAAPSSVAAAESYFRGFGLTATAHPDGLLLSVEGPAPAMAAAFGTTFDRYAYANGSTFVAHPTAASLPAIAPWTGVYGLGPSPAAQTEYVSEPLATAASPSASCAGVFGVLTPCQVATAYDFPWITGGDNGSGTTIAIIDVYSSGQTQNELADDLSAFSSNFGLSSPDVTFSYPVPTSQNLNASGTNPGWGVEDSIDLEWAHASAPGASLDMVFSPNAGTGLYYAIDWVVAEDTARVISMSWAEPEVGVPNASSYPCASACNASTDGSFAILSPVLELAAAEGIGAFGASGDCGAADGTDGVSVSYPASDPYVTGVGATNLTLGADSAYGSEYGWSGNASGYCENQGGSGGGFSILPRPAWQTGEGTVPDAGRGVPDVSMVGSPDSPLLIVYGLREAAEAGTSISTPIWAGIEATAVQLHDGPLSSLNPALYRILSGSGYTENFHDILSGSNGYSAHAGWDPVTGIGTPIVAALLPNLTANAVAPSSLSTYVYANPRFGAAPLHVSFSVTTRGGNGNYAIQGVNFGDGNSSAVVGGLVNHTFEAPGVYSVQSYVLDSAGNASASSPVVVVVGGGGALSVALTASSLSPKAGAAVTFNATVTGGSGPFTYNFTFGDGIAETNLSVNSTSHAYALAGGYCAEVVVETEGVPPSGGASARLAIAVGGASAPSCGNPASPISVVAGPSTAPRDAPADFPDLFTVTGGSSAPDGLAAQSDLVVTSPSAPYTAACDCGILRTPGTYTLEDWVNDTVNGGASATTTVTVDSPLVAAFSASTLAGPAPLTVDFSATVSGGDAATASATHWQFGDGTAATGSTAQATYPTPGEYVAVASVSDDGFGNASEAFLLDVEAPGSSALGLEGTIGPVVNVSSGATVTWNASVVGSVAPSAEDEIVWNLGNGGSAFGGTANETYVASVDLLSGDELSASVSLDTHRLTSIVTVPLYFPDFFATEAGGFVPSTDALVLSAEVAPISGAIPLVVDGTAAVSGPGGAQATWHFGDGKSGSGESVNHVYYGAGLYTIEMQGFDAFNDVGTRLSTVDVNAPLSLSGCAPVSLSGKAPYAVELAPTASGGAGPPYTYAWSLPGGTTSDAASVNLSLPNPGTYAVSLTVTDPVGTMYSCAWSITVTSSPPVGPLDVLAVGGAAGAVLGGVFLWATRPRSTRPRSAAPPAGPASP